jgi:hypothetical protein
MERIEGKIMTAGENRTFAWKNGEATVKTDTTQKLTQKPEAEIEKASERKERARESISFMLVFGLIALFFTSFVFAGTVDEAIKLIQALSSALTGLIGAVLGYYFGATTAEKKAGTSS